MLRLLAFIAVLAFAAGVLAPRSLQASCGDWLEHQATSLASNELAELGYDFDRTPSVPRPCQGPHCQKAPAWPVPAPPPPSERQHDSQACLAAKGTQLVLGHSRFFAEPVLCLASGDPRRIDRPPIA